MGVNYYDDLYVKILSLKRSYKAPSFTFIYSTQKFKLQLKNVYSTKGVEWLMLPSLLLYNTS